MTGRCISSQTKRESRRLLYSGESGNTGLDMAKKRANKNSFLSGRPYEKRATVDLCEVHINRLLSMRHRARSHTCGAHSYGWYTIGSALCLALTTLIRLPPPGATSFKAALSRKLFKYISNGIVREIIHEENHSTGMQKEPRVLSLIFRRLEHCVFLLAPHTLTLMRISSK